MHIELERHLEDAVDEEVYPVDADRPCLVVSGSEDLLNAPASAMRLAQIIKADYELFEQTGHNVPVEAAERFNRLCRRFLTKPSAS